MPPDGHPTRWSVRTFRVALGGLLAANAVVALAVLAAIRVDEWVRGPGAADFGTTAVVLVFVVAFFPALLAGFVWVPTARVAASRGEALAAALGMTGLELSVIVPPFVGCGWVSITLLFPGPALAHAVQDPPGLGSTTVGALLQLAVGLWLLLARRGPPIPGQSTSSTPRGSARSAASASAH